MMACPKVDCIVGPAILIYFATVITEIVSSVPVGLTQVRYGIAYQCLKLNFLSKIQMVQWFKYAPLEGSRQCLILDWVILVVLNLF